MATLQGKILFFDTNGLRRLGFDKEITALLNASRNGDVRVCVSEAAIFEYARQVFEWHRDAFLFSYSGMLGRVTRSSPARVLRAYHLAYKSLFVAYRVQVIDHSEAIDSAARDFLATDRTYFSDQDRNDMRDARIFASAVQTLDPGCCIIVSDDGDLAVEFNRVGYQVCRDAKKLLQELSLPKRGEKLARPDIEGILRSGAEDDFSDSFHTFLTEADETYAQSHLPGEQFDARDVAPFDEAIGRIEQLGADDIEARMKILCYVDWFGPIAKTELIVLLGEQQFAEHLILNCADRLVAEDLIRDTGTTYLPDKGGICAAVAESRSAELAALLVGAEDET